jgi:hypothetical protein
MVAAIQLVVSEQCDRTADAVHVRHAWTLPTADSAVAIQIPANTPTRPTIRLGEIGWPTSCVASKPAASGLTVMVPATRVEVVRCSARTQRMNASATPPTPRYIPAIHCGAPKFAKIAIRSVRIPATTKAAAPDAPDVLRPFLINWETVVRYFVRSVEADAGADGTTESAALLERLLGYSGVTALLHAGHEDVAGGPVLAMHFRKGDFSLQMFTTIATLGTPRDITLQELRIECFFPADDQTAALLRSWALSDESLRTR